MSGLQAKSSSFPAECHVIDEIDSPKLFIYQYEEPDRLIFLDSNPEALSESWLSMTKNSLSDLLNRAFNITGIKWPVINSSEALETFQSNPYHFDLVITDQTMPKMTGEELAVQILAIPPRHSHYSLYRVQ